MCGQDVCDARLMGASAVLLIAAVLSRTELRELHELAAALGLDAIVEVHDAREQSVALDLGALLIGVNQRDLTTFEVDTTRAATLAGTFPSDVVTVAESGIPTPADAHVLPSLGYDAILVGEALVRAADPAGAVAALRRAPTATRTPRDPDGPLLRQDLRGHDRGGRAARRRPRRVGGGVHPRPLATPARRDKGRRHREAPPR